jgi:hypothetical protein
MAIQGVEGLSGAELAEEIRKGGKFVVFDYAISILIMTFKRSSEVHFVRAGESAVIKSLPYTLLSLCFGWWGIPWGFIYTPMALFTNFGGGRDVTAQMTNAMRARD